MKFIVITKLMYKAKDTKKIVFHFIFIVKTITIPNVNFIFILKESKRENIDNFSKNTQI